MTASVQIAFDTWATAQRNATKPLAEQSIKVYASMWGAWSGWLARNNLKWHTVRPDEIERFLNGPSPTVANRRKALNPSTMSNYHRQRYWRVLRGVYAQAVREGWIAENPVIELKESDRPRIAAKSRISQILPPGVLALLQDPEVLRRILPQEEEHDWAPLRDRAIIAIIAHVGLTTAEITRLRGQDIRVGGLPLVTLVRGQQMRLDNSEALPYVVDVANAKGDVWRSLPLPESAITSILPWIAKRQQLLGERAATRGELHDRSQYLKQTLFPSRKSLPAPGMIKPIQPASLYYQVDLAFERLYKLPAARGMNKHAQGVKIAQGAAIIRNTVIRHWLDTVGVQETVMRSGLKRALSLRLAPNAKIEVTK